MEDPVTNTVTESDFLALLEQCPLPVVDLLSQIHACETANRAKAAEWTLVLVEELTDRADFPGLFLTLKDRAEQLVEALSPADLRDLLKKANKDRLVAGMR